MNVIFYTTTDDKRKVTKSLSGGTTYNCKLKDNCSIINPTVIVTFSNANNTVKFNYCYIQQFNRYYFVDNITFLNNNMVMIDLSVDVLMSFANSFKNNDCIISRQENTYNAFVTDEKYIVDNKMLNYFKEFPAIFSTEDYVYIISS